MNLIKIKTIRQLAFACDDIARALGISFESARVAASRLAKSGVIIRLKRNVYVLQEKWNVLAREDEFRLANIIQTPSYVSLMSALDYYGITTQAQRDFVESACVYRTKRLKVKEKAFEYFKLQKKLYRDFVREKGVFIATPEKALLDAVYLMSLKRYKFDSGSIDTARLDKKALRRSLRAYPEKTGRMAQRLWKI